MPGLTTSRYGVIRTQRAAAGNAPRRATGASRRQVCVITVPNVSQISNRLPVLTPNLAYDLAHDAASLEPRTGIGRRRSPTRARFGVSVREQVISVPCLPGMSSKRQRGSNSETIVNAPWANCAPLGTIAARAVAACRAMTAKVQHPHRQRPGAASHSERKRLTDNILCVVIHRDRSHRPTSIPARSILGMPAAAETMVVPASSRVLHVEAAARAPRVCQGFAAPSGRLNPENCRTAAVLPDRPCAAGPWWPADRRVFC